jgi:hypothetical protein
MSHLLGREIAEPNQPAVLQFLKYIWCNQYNELYSHEPCQEIYNCSTTVFGITGKAGLFLEREGGGGEGGGGAQTF